MNDLTRKMLADQAAVCSGAVGLHAALEDIFFDGSTVTSSDGVVTLTQQVAGDFGFVGAVNGKAMAGCLASMKGQDIAIEDTGKVVRFSGSKDTFRLPKGPLDTCPVTIQHEWYDWEAEIGEEFSPHLYRALSFISSRTGVDATFQWTSGVTIRCTSSGFWLYSTNNVTLGVAFVPCSVPEDLAKGVSALVSSAFIKACLRAASWQEVLSFRFAKDAVEMKCASGSVVGACIHGEAAPDEYLERAEPFMALDTSLVGTEVVEALARHRALGQDTRSRITGKGRTVLIESRAGDNTATCEVEAAEEVTGSFFGETALMARSMVMAATWALSEDALVLRGEDGEYLLLCAMEEDDA